VDVAGPPRPPCPRPTAPPPPRAPPTRRRRRTTRTSVVRSSPSATRARSLPPPSDGAPSESFLSLPLLCSETNRPPTMCCETICETIVTPTKPVVALQTGARSGEDDRPARPPTPPPQSNHATQRPRRMSKKPPVYDPDDAYDPGAFPLHPPPSPPPSPGLLARPSGPSSFEPVPRRNGVPPPHTRPPRYPFVPSECVRETSRVAPAS